MRPPTPATASHRRSTSAGWPGMDLVRRTLEEARGAARNQGKDVGRGRNVPDARRVAGRRRTWSGPGPDGRDPQTLGAATRDLARTRGWSARVAEGTVFGSGRRSLASRSPRTRRRRPARRGAQRVRRIHGVGDPIEDGASPTSS